MQSSRRRSLLQEAVGKGDVLPIIDVIGPTPSGSAASAAGSISSGEDAVAVAGAMEEVPGFTEEREYYTLGVLLKVKRA